MRSIKKNHLSTGYLFIILALANLPVLYLLGKLMNWVTFRVHGSFPAFVAGILFFGVLVLLNGLFFSKGISKKVKRQVGRILLKTKTSRNISLRLLPWVLLTGWVFFRLWNIELLVQQRIFDISGFAGHVFHAGNNLFSESTIKWGNAPMDAEDTKEILNTGIYSDYGRFLRANRWHNQIQKAEKRYRIEENLLAGLIMQESMGNPLELNSGDDGGAGLMMFQPGTAREYGLKIYGNSTATGRDKSHGKQLRQLVEKKKFSYRELSRLDERFHVEKSINAGARFLSQLHGRHLSWDKAVSAYNRGKPALLPIATRHVRQVRHFQDVYGRFLKK